LAWRYNNDGVRDSGAGVGDGFGRCAVVAPPTVWAAPHPNLRATQASPLHVIAGGGMWGASTGPVVEPLTRTVRTTTVCTTL
jgi:hypothetical protein